PEVDPLPPGGPRVRALLLLASGVVETNDEIRLYLDEALTASASDPALRASVLLEIVQNDTVIRVERIPAGEEAALEALAVAGTGGGALERQALYTLAWVRALRGRPLDDVLERFHAAADVASFVTESPERVAGQRLFWRGEIEPARALVTRLLALADEYGESYSYVLQRLHMCQLELRVGDCQAAG